MSIFVNKKTNRLITIEKTERISINSVEFEEFKMDIKERLNVKLKTGEFLINQFAIHKANLGEKYGDKTEYYNVSEILNLIEKN